MSHFPPTFFFQNHPELEEIKIFDHEFHISLFADDTVSFLKALEVISIFLKRPALV